MARLFKGIKKHKENMANEEVVAPEATIEETPAVADVAPEEQRFAVIVDQKGFFLRAEVNGVELSEGEFDLYEEEVETKEINAELNEETTDQPEAESGDKCPECNGRGLKSDTEMCSACEGSGKVI